jgi:hypothetical protein
MQKKHLIYLITVLFLIQICLLGYYFLATRSTGKITYDSNLPSEFTVQPDNTHILDQLTTSWGTFTEDNKVTPGIKNFKVVVVTDIQPTGQIIDASGTVLTSHSSTVDNGTLNIFVYLNPQEVLVFESGVSISARITVQTLWAIYLHSKSKADPDYLGNISNFQEFLIDNNILLTPIVYVKKN